MSALATDDGLCAAHQDDPDTAIVTSRLSRGTAYARGAMSASRLDEPAVAGEADALVQRHAPRRRKEEKGTGTTRNATALRHGVGWRRPHGADLTKTESIRSLYIVCFRLESMNVVAGRKSVGMIVAEHPLQVGQQLTEQPQRLPRITTLPRQGRHVAAGRKGVGMINSLNGLSECEHYLGIR